MSRIASSLTLLCLLPVVSICQSQPTPLTRSEILGRLALGESPSYLGRQVRVRGINFSANTSYLQLISLAGGNGILYERVSSAPQTPDSSTAEYEPSLLQLGKCAELIHSGATDRAKTPCLIAIDENPKSPWPSLIVLRLVAEEDSAADRLDLARRAVALAPDFSLAHIALVKALPEGPERDAEQQRLMAVLSKGRDFFPSDFFFPRDVPVPDRSPGEEQHFEETIRKALQDGSDLVSTHVELAEALFSREQKDRALSEMRDAVKLEPDNSLLHEKFAQFYGWNGDHSLEIAEYREAVRSQPYGLSVRQHLAKALIDLYRFPEALQELKEATVLYPLDSSQCDLVVETYEQLHDLPPAIAELRRYLKAKSVGADAISHAKNTQEVSHRLAMLLYKNHEYDAADQVFVEILRYDPDNADIHNDYGGLLFSENKPGEAAAQFRETLRISPTMPQAHNNLGLCLMRSKKLDEAIAEFQQSLELEPDYTHARTSIGLAYQMKGDLPKAIAVFREVVEENPDDSYAHASLGLALESKKDSSEAILELAKALELKEDMPTVQNDLAWLYATAPIEKDRNPQKALFHAKQAVSLLSKRQNIPPAETAAFLDTLAEALVLNGQATEALATEEKASALDPKNLELKIRLEKFRTAAASHSISRQ